MDVVAELVSFHTILVYQFRGAALGPALRAWPGRRRPQCLPYCPCTIVKNKDVKQEVKVCGQPVRDTTSVFTRKKA